MPPDKVFPEILQMLTVAHGVLLCFVQMLQSGGELGKLVLGLLPDLKKIRGVNQQSAFLKIFLEEGLPGLCFVPLGHHVSSQDTFFNVAKDLFAMWKGNFGNYI